MSSTSGLQQLHSLHLQLKEVLDCLDRGPKQIKAREQSVQQRQNELDNLKDRVRKLRLTLDQANLQLKSNEAKLDGLRGKLNAANSNKEYEVFTSQIEADTMSNSVLEDEILGMLDKMDEGKQQIVEAEQSLEAARIEEKKLVADIAAAEPGYKARVAELQLKIQELERFIPEDIKPQFRRMVQQNGASAFSEVEGNVCTGCYVTLPPQTYVELKGGKVMFCKSCGRLMYIRPAELV